MKLTRYLVLVCLLCPIFAYAQRPLTIVGGVVTANVADTNDFQVTLTANVTGVTLTSTTGSANTPVTPSTGYQITMRFVQDATGSRTVVFGGNISTSCSVNSTANSVTICRWQYTASSNTWADAGGSSISPNSPTSPLGVSINVKASPYNAKGDTQQTAPNVSTIAPGSNGCPAGAVTGCFVVPGTLFTQSDIGKTIYFNAASLNVLLPTTIAHINAGTGGSAGSQMIDVAVWVLTGGCGSVCIGVWGTDDTLALQLAAGAVKTIGASLNCQTVDNVIWQPVCARLYFPPGGYMTSGGGTTTVGGPGFPGITTGVGSSVVGSGQNATTFFMRPDYNIGALAAGSGMLLHNPCDVASDFQVTSSGFTFASITANPIISSGCSSTTTARIRIAATGVNSGQLFTIGGTHSTAKDIMVQDPPTTNGGVLLQFNGGTLDVYNIFVSNNTSTTAPNLQITNYTGGTSGGRLTVHGGFVDECNVSVSTPPNACTMVVGSKDVSFYGTTLLGGAFGSVALSVDATSEVRAVGVLMAPFGGNTSTDVFVASGGQFRSTMSKFIASGASSAAWNCAVATSCFDGGENIYTLTNSAVLYAAGTFPPTFVVANNATSQLGGRQTVAGNVPTFAVTGFGTGPTITVQTGSTDAAGAAIITAGTTPGSSGTFTLTFSTAAGAYGTNKPVCTFTLIDGTGAWNALAQEPRGVDASTTTTSVLANWADNSIALTAGSTYGFNWSCYGK